ncbi:MAG TPA: hypothetical protein VII06_13310 [Chloroflexota bacterium]|jgi:hypothetical protein
MVANRRGLMNLSGAGLAALVALVAAAHNWYRISDLRVVGSNVHGRYAVSGDAVCADGVDRLEGTFLISVPRDAVALYIAMPDLTDEQTARSLAVGASPAGPAPRGAACG